MALGASLLTMVANLTIGKKRYVGVQYEIKRIRDEAVAIRDSARRLITDDVEAYEDVASAMALPRDSEEGSRIRTLRVQEALKKAVEPPLDTMNAALSVLRLASELVDIGNKSAVSDVGAAALSALSGFRTACLNVEINLQSIRDVEWVEHCRGRLVSPEDALDLERAVVQRTTDIITGTDR